MQLVCKFTLLAAFWNGFQIVNCRHKSGFWDCELCISEMHLSKIHLFSYLSQIVRLWHFQIVKCCWESLSEIVNHAFDFSMHLTLEQGPVLSSFNLIQLFLVHGWAKGCCYIQRIVRLNTLPLSKMAETSLVRFWLIIFIRLDWDKFVY